MIKPLLVIIVLSLFITLTEYLRLKESKAGKYKKLINMFWHLTRDASLIGCMAFGTLILDLPLYALPFLWAFWWVLNDGLFSFMLGRGFFDKADKSGNIWETVPKIKLIILILTLVIYVVGYYNWFF